MKNGIFIILLCVFALGCSPNKHPQKVAERFLDSYLNGDLEEAVELCTPECRAELSQIKEQMLQGGILKERPQVFIQVDEGFVIGDTARYGYTLRNQLDDAASVEQELIVVRKDEQWWVDL